MVEHPRQTSPNWSPRNWARSTWKITTWNLLQNVQQNRRNRGTRCLRRFIAPIMSPRGAAEGLATPTKTWTPEIKMEAQERNCFSHRPVFCSVIFFNLFLKLRYRDSVAVCRKNWMEEQDCILLHSFTASFTLSSVTRNNIAWSFFFRLWCNKRVWGQSVSFHCFREVV